MTLGLRGVFAHLPVRPEGPERPGENWTLNFGHRPV